MARLAFFLALVMTSAIILFSPVSSLQLVATIGQVAGGSCGYTNFPPPLYMVTGFSEVIYRGGAMCGSCFRVQCFNDRNCIRGRAVNVMVTSICQSTNGTDVCNTGNMALNLDPRAWDLIVSTRAVGSVPVAIYAVSCPQMVGGVQFNVSVASVAYMQVLIQNVGGMGRLTQVFASADGVKFFPMYRNYGSVWAINNVNFLKRAVTFKLVDMNQRALTIPAALPANWGLGGYITRQNWRV
uniref:Expansin n=1 Tax=Micrasterias denticulata TaxID=407018 RepID=G4V4D2_9VIRI|nr:expansin [Micrasterias denticulata]